MSADKEEPTRSGRPKREEATQTERRRRKGGTQQKLAIPDEYTRKYPEMDFRHAVDDEGRIEQLTQNDDWEKVPGAPTIHAGTGAGGQATKYHLLMKPKKFMAQDRAEREAHRQRIQQQQTAHPEAQQAIASGSDNYSPPGNQIS